MHVQIKYSLFTKSTIFNPFFGRHNNYKQHKPVKVVNLTDLLEGVFNLCMHECTYPDGLVIVWSDTNNRKYWL